jgi:flagellar motor switch protein FliN/FliY
MPEGEKIAMEGADAKIEDEITGPAQFGNLTKDAVASGNQNLDFILDIPVVVTVELGRTRMLVNDLLQLGQGSVVELEKLAGEPVEIVVNDRLIARGEVVVVNDKFGVRLTDIISPLERIKQLK